MKIPKKYLHLISALAFSAALAIGIDIVFGFFSKHVSLVVFAAIFLVSLVLILLLKLPTKRLWVCLCAAALVTAALIGSVLLSFRHSAAYAADDTGKAELYANKKALVLVPHQDDEILVAGGVIEEYLKYGSEVYIAFYTNGDFAVAGEVRLKEALAVAEHMGVPEDHVIFLGYGDNMGTAKHFYNLDSGEQAYSAWGHTQTYALEGHGPYRNSVYYRENVVADLKSLALELRPDIIFCADFEEHPDHSALSLFFDEAMESILKDNDTNYHPVLLKSACYSTAFVANSDFFSDNLRSTVPPPETYFALIYDWEDRVRFPINGEGLSHSIFGCDVYEQFKLHKSQWVLRQAERAINGDKVFWLRDTNGLCYDAQISTSSGNAAFLNDFKLVDNQDLANNPMLVTGCTWVPDVDDGEKTAYVTLPEASYIQRICLYDEPHAQRNILNALISFDDGSSIETGPLNWHSITTIPVEKDNVKSFSVRILEAEGEGAGLVEIEAYSTQRDYGFDYIKLQNSLGDFVYDYYIDESGTEQFTVFSSNVEGDFVVSCDNSACSAEYTDDIITINCPKGESCSVCISSEDGECSDTVVISNPGKFMRRTGPHFERLARAFKSNLERCNCVVIYRAVYGLALTVLYSIF